MSTKEPYDPKSSIIKRSFSAEGKLQALRSEDVIFVNDNEVICEESASNKMPNDQAPVMAPHNLGASGYQSEIERQVYSGRFRSTTPKNSDGFDIMPLKFAPASGNDTLRSALGRPKSASARTTSLAAPSLCEKTGGSLIQNMGGLTARPLRACEIKDFSTLNPTGGSTEELWLWTEEV
jgi:hypothetical protein